MRIDWSPLFGYDVFISYKRGDGPIGSSGYAKRLKERLSTIGYQCFLDDDDSPPGEALSPAVERGIRRSRVMVVLCTSAALESSWVTKEVGLFAKKRRGNIIPIEFSQCLTDLNPTDTDLSSLAQNGLIRIPEQSSETPSDSIIGGIQARFKYRQANTLRTGFLAAIAIVLAAALVVAIAQRNEAQRQTEDAKQQRQQAEQQREYADHEAAIAEEHRKDAERRPLAKAKRTKKPIGSVIRPIAKNKSPKLHWPVLILQDGIKLSGEDRPDQAVPFLQLHLPKHLSDIHFLQELFFIAKTGEEMRDLPVQSPVALAHLVKKLRSPFFGQRKSFMEE